MVRRRKFWIYFSRIFILLLGGAAVSVYIALSKVNLESLRGELAAGLENATGFPVEIRGAMSWRFSLRPRIVLYDVAVRSADWAVNPDGVHIQRIYAHLDLFSLFTSAPTIEALRIDGMRVFLEQNARGEYSLESSEPVPTNGNGNGTSAKFPLDFGEYGLKSVHFSDVVIRIIRPQDEQEWVVGRFALDYKKEKNTLQYSGYISKSGKVFPFIISMQELDQERRVYPVRFAFADSGNPIVADVALEMTSKIPIDFIIKGTLKKPTQFFGHMGIDFPETPPIVLNLAGGFGHGKVTLRKSSISIGANDLTVSGSFNWSGRKPVIVANIKSKNFSLMEVFPELYKPGPAWTRPKRPLHVFHDIPLYSEILREYDAEFSAEVERLRVYRELAVENIDARGIIKNDAMDVRLSARFADGTVTARVIGNDAHGGLVAQAAGRAENIHVGQILESVGEKDVIAELPTNFEFYLEGGGENLSELVSNTWGHVNVYSVGKGYAYSELVEYLYGQDFLTSLRHSINDMFRSNKKHDQMTIWCATVNLKVRAGRVETERGVAVSTNAINIRAKGWIDFGQEEMKVVLVTVPVRGLRLSISGNIVNSMEITGNLAEPDIKISGAAIAAKAATATGIGLLLAPFTGGLSIVAGAGLGLLTGNLLENWLSDSQPCETAQKSGAPKEPGDPDFMNIPVMELVNNML